MAGIRMPNLPLLSSVKTLLGIDTLDSGGRVPMSVLIAALSSAFTDKAGFDALLVELSNYVVAYAGLPPDSFGRDGQISFDRAGAAIYGPKGSVTPGHWPPTPVSLVGPSAYAGTSTSSVAIGTGSQSFTVEPGLAYFAGQRLIGAADATHWIEGVVTAYSGTTLTILVDKISALTGTFNSWAFGPAGQGGPAGPSAYAGTSTSSIAIGTGSKSFTTQSGLAYFAGQRLTAAADANNSMEGVVSSYSGTALVLTIDAVRGSGTFASWTFGPAGSRGQGVPTGGAAGQALVKVSGSDYDTTWVKGPVDAVNDVAPEFSMGARTAAVGGNASGDLSTRDYLHFNRRSGALVANQHFTAARQRMDKTIVLWGHSAVQGSGATSLGGDSAFAVDRWWISGSIGYWLEQMLGWRWRAIAKGISSQWPEHVGSRQGGVPTYITVTGNSIPAAGSTVALTAIVPGGGPFRYRGAYANELYGTVNGVMCRLSTPGDAVDPPNYSIEQVSGGSALTCSAGTRFVPWTDQLEGAVNVFWHLRNGTLTVANAKQITGMMVRKAIANGCDRYVILGPWPFNAETTGNSNNTAILAINSDLSDRYGAHFFDVSAFLRRQYPYDNTLYPSAFTLLGLTETSNDTTDIGNGIIPRQFMSGDGNHPNNTGYQAIAKGLIEIHFATLGIVKIIGSGVYQ